MAQQLWHPIKVAERPNITVQVIPSAGGAHPGVNGSSVLLEFAKTRTIVHLKQAATVSAASATSG